jgi:hypothetical protein
MTDEIDYFENKRSDKTYISKRITPTLPDGREGRPVRIASKVFDLKESHSFAQEHGEVVIRVTPGQREEIVARFYEDDRGLFGLVIQRFTRSNGNPQKVGFSFFGEEIPRLLNFLGNLRNIHFPDGEKVNITDQELQRLLSAGQLHKLLVENQDAVAQLLRSEITTSDLIALGYRKQQLERFRKLLFEPDFFSSEKTRLDTTEEGLWQGFFEANKWIFGYGLTYLFLSSLDERKLEQIVVGSDIFGKGKRADAILKSRGAVEALCFVEIKKHTTELLKSAPYRSACWAPSEELAGGIVQAQVTVEMTMKKIAEKFEPTNQMGEPTGEQIFSYHPRSVLVVGSLGQFQTESGVNLEKYRSFELYRRHTTRPEVVTFDELYERAKFIVDNVEK